MPRAQGANAQLLLIDEITYGTKPSGNWNKLPFHEFDYGADQKLIPDDSIGLGREPIDPAYDVIDVQHSGIVPVDLNNIGYWLKGLLGAAVDTGAGPYVHTFTSGAATLPSRSIEVGFKDIGQYFVKTGAVVGSMEFDWKGSGLVDTTVNIIAQNDSRTTSTSGGTPPAVPAFKRFSAFTGSILLNGSAIAGITEAKLKFDNKLDAARVIRADGLIEGVDPTLIDCSGTLTARFEDATLYGDAEALGPVALQLAWTIDTNDSLTFTLPRVYLPRVKSKVSGPGGVSVSFNWEAVHDPTATYLMQAVLKNSIATY